MQFRGKRHTVQDLGELFLQTPIALFSQMSALNLRL